MPRLDQMSMRDIEDAGQRFYERLGARNGEDAEGSYCVGWVNGCHCDMHDPDDEIIAEPDERLQPWEVEE